MPRVPKLRPFLDPRDRVTVRESTAVEQAMDALLALIADMPEQADATEESASNFLFDLKDWAQEVKEESAALTHLIQLSQAGAPVIRR